MQQIPEQPVGAGAPKLQAAYGVQLVYVPAFPGVSFEDPEVKAYHNSLLNITISPT